MNKHVLLLLGIVLVGFVFRFYQLGEVPRSLNWDEVSWGYNGYSIASTGKDEHGESYPLSFKAFGDFKQPVYVYLNAVTISLFGLNEFAVRFPSAFFGTLTILFVYLFVNELFHKSEKRSLLALFSSAFFALSPWSIQFSRVAFEANVGIFFTICGVWFLLRGMRLRSYWSMSLGAIVISLSAYSYHSQKIFSPILFAGLLFYGYKTYGLKKILIAVIFLFFILCNLLWLADPRTTSRGRSVTFFSDSTQLLQKPTEKLIYDQKLGDKFGSLLHNRRLVYLKKYFENYLMHFDPNYLFLTGDNPRHHSPRMGIIYLSLLPLIIAGIYRIVSRKMYAGYILLFWMFIAPVSSALAVNAPNASRTMVFLPTYQIFAALGLVFLLSMLKKNQRRLAYLLFGLVFAGNVAYYSHMYFNHTNTDFGEYWQDGYKEAVLFVNKEKRPGQTVLFAKEIEQPYIFYLFYTKFDPQKFHAIPNKNKPCQKIDTVYFGDCKVELASGDLLITKDKNIVEGYTAAKEIIYPNGKHALSVFQKQ